MKNIYIYQKNTITATQRHQTIYEIEVSLEKNFVVLSLVNLVVSKKKVFHISRII